MADYLNPWLPGTLSKARKLVEDSDRRTLADRLFVKLIRDAHRIATAGAVACPDPELERYQNEEGVTLILEWHDRESGWHLQLFVKRRLGEKPVTGLDFFGAHKSYSSERPTDAEINTALYDYFENWKREDGTERAARP